jgi:hypothetical protein
MENGPRIDELILRNGDFPNVVTSPEGTLTPPQNPLVMRE